VSVCADSILARRKRGQPTAYEAWAAFLEGMEADIGAYNRRNGGSAHKRPISRAALLSVLARCRPNSAPGICLPATVYGIILCLPESEWIHWRLLPVSRVQWTTLGSRVAALVCDLYMGRFEFPGCDEIPVDRFRRPSATTPAGRAA
jgi:hypothetical protein